MMVVGLVKKKAGLTDQQFRDYYEDNHAPLVVRTLPYIAGYTRRYVVREGERSSAYSHEGPPGLEFDAIAEMTFATPEDYQQMLAALEDPAIAAPLFEDEERFLDRDAMVINVMDEERSDIAALRSA